MSQAIAPSQFAPATAVERMSNPRRHYNPVQKDAVTFVQTAEESAGTQTLIDMEVAPGGGNFLHYHRTFAEHFTVLSGQLGVQIGNEQFTLKPGESAVAPIGSLHRWFNPTSEVAFVRVELVPGSRGFERSLQIAYGLARDGLVNNKGLPKSMAHMALLIELSDTGVPGLFSAIAPIMRMIAERARRKGVERQLIERYCR